MNAASNHVYTRQDGTSGLKWSLFMTIATKSSDDDEEPGSLSQAESDASVEIV